jgi:hypothetical protein
MGRRPQPTTPYQSEKGIEMSNPTHPVFGDMAVDATGVTVVVLTPAQIKKMSKIRKDFAKALESFVLLTPEQCTALGITTNDFKEVVGLQVEVAYLDELLGPTAEILHRLHTTRVARAHRLATLLHGAASTASKRAKRDPDAQAVLSTLGDLLTYVSKPSRKGAATRAKKNAAAKTG